MLMKKRFLSMLVLLAAVVTGAWAEGKVRISVSNVYGNETDKLGSGCLVYFLTTDMASTDSWAKQPSFEAFKNALEGKYSKGLTTNGALGNTVVNNSDLGLTDEASVTCYLLILNSSEITEGVSYYITQTTNITTSAVSMVSASFGTQATNSQNPANWHEVPAAPAGYTVSMPQDTPDAEKWTARAGTDGTYQQLPLEGVAAGTAVSVKYNGAKKVKSVKAKKKAAALIVNPVVGQVIGSDGKNYDANATLPDGVTALAKIAYVGSDNGEAAPYNHGLALALSDANDGSTYKWSTNYTNVHGYRPTSSSFTSESGLQYNATHNSDTYPAFKAAITYSPAAPTGCSAWFLASGYQWQKMAGVVGGLTNLGFQGWVYYWTSTEYNPGTSAWRFSTGTGDWFSDYKDSDSRVRACLAF